MDIAHFETTTAQAHTAVYQKFLSVRGIDTKPLLQQISWDLIFGACHFCSFKIVDLADFTQKLPK